MLSVPWVKQHHKGGVAHTLLWKPFSLPSLQPQEGHILKLNSLALLSLWLCVNHQKRSKPECPPPYPKGAWCRLASLVFTSNWSLLGYVWLSSVNWLSASSSGTLEFHLCNSNLFKSPYCSSCQLIHLINHILPSDDVISIKTPHDFLHMLWVFRSWSL